MAGSLRTIVCSIFVGIFLQRYSITIGLWSDKNLQKEKHFEGTLSQ